MFDEMKWNQLKYLGEVCAQPGKFCWKEVENSSSLPSQLQGPYHLNAF